MYWTKSPFDFPFNKGEDDNTKIILYGLSQFFPFEGD